MSRSKWLERFGSILLVLAATRYLLMFFHRGANLLDEGSQVAMANRILHGDVIYRDFLTVATPGSFYTVAWLFQLFGAGLIVVRWAVVALNLGILVVTLFIARQLMSWPFAAASALMTVVWGWFLVAPNLYSLEAMFFALVGLACYLGAVRPRGGSHQPPPRLRSAEALRAKAEDPPRHRWLLISGVACGIAMMVKQNIGIYAALGLGLSLWMAPPYYRRRWHFAAGAALVVIPVVLYLAAIGAGPHLYENLMYYPLQRYPQGLEFDYPPLFPLGGPDRWQKLVLYLPSMVYPLAAVTIFVAANRSEARALTAVTLVGALTFLQAFPRADVTHILFGMPPAFILLGFFCYRLSRLFALARVPVVAAIGVAVGLLPMVALVREGDRLTRAAYEIEYVPLTTERARGVRTSLRNAAQIDQVTAYLQKHTAPGDPVFVVPWAAGFYFLADRPNPTRFDVLLYGDPEEYPCLISTLDQRKPTFVVYGYGWDVDGRRFRDYAQPIDDYIRTRYQVAERFDEYEIWRRHETAAPVYVDSPPACRRRVLDGREYRRLWRQIWGG